MSKGGMLNVLALAGTQDRLVPIHQVCNCNFVFLSGIKATLLTSTVAKNTDSQMLIRASSFDNPSEISITSTEAASAVCLATVSLSSSGAHAGHMSS